MSKRPTISFEFFPPKNDEIAKGLWDAFPLLADIGSKYMTVTYGAGGSTKVGTVKTLQKMRAHLNEKRIEVPLAAHLSFLSTTKVELDAYLDRLLDAGVNHIVALRGDLPQGTSYEDFAGDEYYAYTYDFIEALKAKNNIRITVGGYPEKHPDAPTLDADIEHLKKKCEAGADAVTTQYFFDNDVFFDFVDKCQAAGITTPIQPGLLPIYDFEACKHFSARCASSIPDWLHAKFEGQKRGSDEALKVAEEIFVKQVLELAEAGVEHIHFYSMNKAPMTIAACKAIGYSKGHS